MLCALGNDTISPVQHHIHKMLGEVLGGIDFVQVAVVTPYFCTVGEYYTANPLYLLFSSLKRSQMKERNTCNKLQLLLQFLHLG